MAKIKIISNPYQKDISYKRWSESRAEWEDISVQTTPNSKLLNRTLVEGFFPFRAKQIVELIVDEYGVAEEPLTIEFEGSADEYQELVEVCKLCESDIEIIPKRSEIGLENARDILPEVKNLFQEMRPLIHQSVSDTEKIDRDLNRFSEASSDVVPICVLGNYSAGKSTFISALIGSEILPSGSEPITAKVYKIERSKYADRAQIHCKYYDRDLTVLFTDKESRVEESLGGNPLTEELTQALEELDGESISVRMNRALSIINDYETLKEENSISDLIEVDIPFVKGVLAKSQHPFVIFDTPGSNSASNAKHLMVLKEAMANMTNGLPIFLCTAETLDSTDNENLYHIIDDLEELDNRFTMIVVNKADNAGVQRRGTSEMEKKRILSQAVPRNLYSGGLFYVSSILGLGAKSDGEFVDEVYADIYDAQEHRYSNPSNKFYRSLYLYDIMPDQIKVRADELAANQSELVYANSGLFTIENEIETFAGKYAAYNKCFQSQLFLTKVIQTTEKIIEQDTVASEEIRKSIKDKLEDDKKDLVEILEDEAYAKRDKCDANYAGHMKKYLAEAEGTFSEEDLREQEEKFTENQEEQQKYDEKEQGTKEAWKQIGQNLKTNVGNIFKKNVDSSMPKAAAEGFTNDIVTENQEQQQVIDENEQDTEESCEQETENLKSNEGNTFKQNVNMSVFKEIAEKFTNDVSTAIKTSKDQFDTHRNVNKAVADEMLNYVAVEYKNRLREVYALLNDRSKEYWTTNMEELRDLLVTIVTGSDVLTDEWRTTLKHLIIEYKQIVFDENSIGEIFDFDRFVLQIKVGNQTIWMSDHLNLEKLARAYNTNIVQNAENAYNIIEASHRESAHDWIRDLLNDIFENLVEYSPELSKQARQIQNMTKQIEGLKKRQAKLKEYTEQLCSMMDWKTVS